MVLARTGADDWSIREPRETPADSIEVSSLLSALSDLRIERVRRRTPGRLGEYGLPGAEIGLKMKGESRPVTIHIGAENPVGGTFYARREGDPRIVLLPNAIKPSLGKSFFDFRRKDVFRFETGDVTRIEVSSGDVRWEARKGARNGSWKSRWPPWPGRGNLRPAGLIGRSRAARIRRRGQTSGRPRSSRARTAEAVVRLSFPSPRKDLVFAFQSVGGKTLAANSNSPLIVVPVVDPLSDLKREAEAYREKRIAVFNSWEVSGFSVKNGDMRLDLARGADGTWSFASGGTGRSTRRKQPPSSKSRAPRGGRISRPGEAADPTRTG